MKSVPKSFFICCRHEKTNDKETECKCGGGFSCSCIEMHQIKAHLPWFKKTFGLELKVEVLEEQDDKLVPAENDNDSALGRLLQELDADKPAPQE